MMNGTLWDKKLYLSVLMNRNIYTDQIIDFSKAKKC